MPIDPTQTVAAPSLADTPFVDQPSLSSDDEKPSEILEQGWTVEIFRTGTFKSMQGCDLSFSETDLSEIAAAYDPKTAPAPLVVGHPKSDDPAFGWISCLKHQSGRLIADIEQVSNELATLVKEGRYRKISAAFFGPQSKANPRPGHYHLKHVGLLGAAAPAVPGLKLIGDAAFMTDERDVRIELDLPVELAMFSNAPDSITKSSETVPDSAPPLIALFHALRRFLFETYGTDAARRALPPELITALEDATHAESEAKTSAESSRQDQMFAENIKAISQREAALRGREDRAFVEDLVSQGKPLGGEIGQRALGCLAQLSDLELDPAFCSEAKTNRPSPHTELKALLADLPTQVPLGELALQHRQPDFATFAAPPGTQVDLDGLETHSRILAWQADHPGTSYADAALQMCRTSSQSA